MGEEGSRQLDGQNTLNHLEIDTIGEILNISMGSAATAVSTMLDQLVNISTPKVTLKNFSSSDYKAMDPAVMVKIDYVEGVSGTNLVIFRSRDMQVILNLLMGNDEEPTDDFVFDELSMSAACEIMNQMMGASATALSEFLGFVVNISTPEAKVVDSPDTYREAVGVQEGDEIVSVTFHMKVGDVVDTDFASVMQCSLVKQMVKDVTTKQEISEESLQASIEGAEAAAAAAPAAPAEPPKYISAADILRRAEEEEKAKAAAGGGAAPAPAPAAPAPGQYISAADILRRAEEEEKAKAAAPAPAPAAPTPPPAPAPAPMAAPAPAAAAAPAAPPGYPPAPAPGAMPQMPYGYPPYGYPGYPPYPYPPYGPDAGAQQQGPTLNVQNTQFPQFTVQPSPNPNLNGNMDLLLGVALDVTVEIGSTKRKIKEVLEFGQGTVIELDKQAGAPVDIVVNGKLLARGDVVVIDDNFGVRITEILGTRELMESLKEENA